MLDGGRLFVSRFQLLRSVIDDNCDKLRALLDDGVNADGDGSKKSVRLCTCAHECIMSTYDCARLQSQRVRARIVYRRRISVFECKRVSHILGL
jgi:hypothetical protein